MIRSTLIAEASIPGSDRVLQLYQGKDDCSIVLTGAGELMSTRKFASEEALATLACEMHRSADKARVLIGGLGMGFTLAGGAKCHWP